MSHFSVLVIGDDIESALRPYQENNMGDCPEEYMAFTDVEEEYLKEYNEDSVEQIRTPEGEFTYAWDERFRVPGTFGTGGGTHEPPADLERVKVPFKEKYPTFEEFMSVWGGYPERDPKTGRYGRWENPNAKWDYYGVGGRFEGRLRTKAGEYVSSCTAGEVDWEAMTLEKRIKAESKWAAHEAKTLEKIDYIRGDIRKDDTKETYMGRNAVPDATFAVIKDGQWYEQGKMGWWGMVKDQKDAEQWASHFQTLVNSLPPEIRLTVVDCHI
jgi:hypothetical protein